MNKEELRQRWEEGWSLTGKLAKRIERRIGHKVVVAPTRKSFVVGFYAPKNLAYADVVVSAEYIPVSTKEEWAVCAGVDKLADGRNANGWWGKPSVWWNLRKGNIESLEKIAGILAKVCEVRHRQ